MSSQEQRNYAEISQVNHTITGNRSESWNYAQNIALGMGKK